MRKHFRFSVFVALIILLSLGGVNLTQAQQSVNPVSISNIISQEVNQLWHSQYVHQVSFPDDVGTYASLALRPFDDIPYISYYNATNGNLMLAHLLPHGGGNCGTNNKWECQVLDGDDGSDVGSYTSIDFFADESSQTWTIGISYHDGNHHALKFTSWICSEYCSEQNTVTIAVQSLPYNAGIGTSLAFAPDGNPHIAYYLSNRSGDDYLMYASFVGSGGNCGVGSVAGEWDCEIIVSGPTVGQYPSLNINSAGVPWIGYYDGQLQEPWLTYYYSGSGNCGINYDWNCFSVEKYATDDVGRYISIIAGGDYLAPHTAYYDQTNGHLKYSFDMLSDHPVVVDDMGLSDSPMGISMALDKDGYPIIAYQKIQDRARLYIARPYLVYDGIEHGNCGDDILPYYPNQYWFCTRMELGGEYLNAANFVSLAVNSSGLGQIAYSEFYDNHAGDYATSLRFYYQQFQFPIFLPIVSNK